MCADMTTSGGSLHPGRPVIWPTGKKQTQSSSTPQPTQTKSKSITNSKPDTTNNK